MDRKLMKPPFSDSPVFRPVLYKGGGGWGGYVCLDNCSLGSYSEMGKDGF